MRLIYLEMKRVLKTRLTWILLAAALVCSFLFAYIPTTFIYYTDASNHTLTGIEAIQKYKEIRTDIEGEVTEEKMKTAVEKAQIAVKKQGVTDIYELPSNIYYAEYLPVSPYMHGAQEELRVNF